MAEDEKSREAAAREVAGAGRGVAGPLVLAGYTARDEAGVREHIEELAREGVPAPERFPVFWEVPASLLTTGADIHVRSRATSGEVEPVLIHAADGWRVAVGSDHTDRALERVDMAASKSACAKPVSAESWRLEDVARHWDQLTMRCEVHHEGRWVAYQEAALDHLRPFAEIMRLAGRNLPVGSVLFLGTAPLETGGFVFGDEYRLALSDPVLGRKLKCSYRVARATGKPEIEFRQAGTFDWKPAVNGVSEAVLARDPDTGAATLLQRYEPGTDTSPTGVQVHDFWEEVYIIEGALHDLTLDETFRAGSYACRPPGMPHGPWRADDGCLLLAVGYYTAGEQQQ
jgi:hypothetical protein